MFADKFSYAVREAATRVMQLRSYGRALLSGLSFLIIVEKTEMKKKVGTGIFYAYVT